MCLENYNPWNVLGMRGFTLSKIMLGRVLWVRENPHNSRDHGFFHYRTLEYSHDRCYSLLLSVVLMCAPKRGMYSTWAAVYISDV